MAFLNARLSEDAADAEGVLDYNAAARKRGLLSTLWDEEDDRANRTLREAAFKRAIVELCARVIEEDSDEYWSDGPWDALTVVQRILRDMAAIWSDHPDYRQEWKR